MATVVVKVGTSSLTDDRGALQLDMVDKLCREISTARLEGHKVVLVTSAAVALGFSLLGFEERPKDTVSLQAAAAVGQGRLQRAWDDGLLGHGVVSGQILLSPHDFFHRKQYLHARGTITHLLQLGAVPVVNENDAVADEEIRFGDNDRVAALVAHAVNAELLVLLTDTAGLFTADPRADENASLVQEIVEIDHELEAAAGGSGTNRGSGGMSAKLTAARMAAWTGVRTVIAASARENVIADAINGVPDVGTVVQPKPQRLSARKMWIAFAMSSAGRIVVDGGARTALTVSNKSLLPAGVRGIEGTFDAEAGVEIVDQNGIVFAKGVTDYPSQLLEQSAGMRTTDLPDGAPAVVVHRDNLVLLAH
jgi:glutamate 5-kinase